MRSRVIAGILLAGTLQGTAPSSAADVRSLPTRYREWLTEVAVLITSEEQKSFLAIDKDYQRDAFIARFWKSRDPYPETQRNELKIAWDQRVEAVRERYGNLEEDRARIFLLRGEPDSLLATSNCTPLWPIEVWTYVSSLELPRNYDLIFYQPYRSGRFLRWTPRDGYGALLSVGGASDPVLGAASRDHLFEQLRRYCPDARPVIRALLAIDTQNNFGGIELAERRIAVKDPEWLATFAAVSTDVPAGAKPLPAELKLAFPGRDGWRTVVAGMLAVPAAEAGVAELAGTRSRNFLLTGEVLKDGELFEAFRYRFDVPAGGAGEPAQGGAVPLAFERMLRPGEYSLVVKLEDLNSGRIFHAERPLAVPEVPETGAAGAGVSAAGSSGAAGAAASGGARPAESEGPLAEAYRSLSGGPGLRLAAPPGEIFVGPVRIEAAVVGDAIRRVTFLLDGQTVLTKSRPPFGVELNLGSVPRTRTVRAVAMDAAGQEVASDELILNAGAQPFSVRLVEPRRGARAAGAVRVRADVHLPEGARLERLEVFLDDARVATLYQPPFAQTVALPGSGTSYVRAVAYLADGTTAEDLVLLNAPDAAEEIDVQLVEVYAAVRGTDKRPLPDLRQEEVAVREDGVEQRIVRFERVAEIPLHVVLVVDTSASMSTVLPAVRQAGAEFLRTTLSERDRAAVVTFSDSPVLASKFTNDITLLAGSLAGLRAERSTALFDCIVFALQYMKGLKGQTALLVISDGGDRASRFSFDDTLELARRSGVAIYTLGLGLSRLNLEGRPRLGRLAEETGGRAFFPGASEDLAPLWAAIGEELRTRWLIAYQSTGTGGPEKFRTVEVQVARPGVEVQALRGYYPK